MLAEGAHNQYGDLPWTARAEMLSRPADSDAYIRFQGLAAGQYFADPGAEACSTAPVTSP